MTRHHNDREATKREIIRLRRKQQASRETLSVYRRDIRDLEYENEQLRCLLTTAVDAFESGGVAGTIGDDGLYRLESVVGAVCRDWLTKAKEILDE